MKYVSQSLITVKNGTFLLNDETAKQISLIKEPVAIVAIAGLYRTGKSFILNQLLGKQNGFQVGPNVHPCTKGIWTCGSPLRVSNKHHNDFRIIFIDTEGQGSFSANETHDSQIFALALLLSSFFVYNSLGNIDDSAIMRLGVVTQLSELINARQSNTDSNNSDLKVYFPSFLWLVRDFSLKLTDEQNRTITPKDYLEMALTTERKEDEKIETRSKADIKKTLREYFPERNCFTLVRPVIDEEQLQNLSQVSTDEFRTEFKTQVGAFTELVLNSVKPKQLNGNYLTGRMFVTLCQSYVDALNGGKIVIDSCWNNVVRTECETALLESFLLYKKLLHARIKERGIIDYEQLNTVHLEAEEESLKLFGQIGVGEEKTQYDKQLRKDMTTEFQKCKDSLCRMSTKFCEEILNNSFSNLNKKLNSYGTLDEFEQDFQSLLKTYMKNAKGGEKSNVLVKGLLHWLLPTTKSLGQNLIENVQHEHSKKLKSLQARHLSEIEEFEQKIEDMEQQREDLLSLQKSLSNKYDEDLRTERSSHAQEVSSLQKEISDTQERIAALTKACDKYEAQSSQFKVSIEKMQKTIQEQHRELSSSNNENQQLVAAKKELEAKLRSTQLEHDRILAIQLQMKSELVQGQLDNESLEQVLHTLRKQVDSLQEENTNAKTQIATLEQKILDAQVRWNEHELDFKTMESTLSNKIQLLEQSTIPELEQRHKLHLKKMKQQLERVESERSEIVQKLEEEQTKANDLSSSSISASHLAQKLERELASKQTQIRSLERMVQAEKEKSQESEEKLRTFMREQTHLSKDRALELEKQVEQLNVTNRRVLEINKSLMEELNHYKSNSSIDSIYSDLGTPTPKSSRKMDKSAILRSPLGTLTPRNGLLFTTPKKEALALQDKENKI